MFTNLIYILPGITLLLFIINIFYKGNTVSSFVLFILAFLPLMDLKITTAAWGGFKTFDAICFSSLILLFKDFTTIDLKNKKPFYLLLFVLLFIIGLLAGLASQFPNNTYINILKLLPIFIFSRFLLLECFKDETFYLKAIRALKVSYLIALAFIFIQWVVGLGFTFYPSLSPNTIDPVFKIVRYPGIFYDSQASGQYLAIGSFLFLFIENGTSLKGRILNYAVFVLAIVGISIAGSRAAFGGFIVGALIAFFMAAKNYRLPGLALIVVAYFAFSAITIQNGIFDRSKNLSDDFIFRQSIWEKAFEITKEHPYIGIGINNYQSYVMRYAQDQYLEVEDGQLVYFDQPENGYLKISAELGFIGFGIFMLFLVVPLIQGFAAFIKGTVDSRIAFLIASIVSWAIAFNTVYSVYDYRILIMVTGTIVLIITYPKVQDEYSGA